MQTHLVLRVFVLLTKAPGTQRFVSGVGSHVSRQY